MRIPSFARSAAMLAAGVFAGCGSPSQPGALPPAGAPPGAAAVHQTSHGVSWMGKGVKQQDLLYVSNRDGIVNVYRYWQHTLVGALTKFTYPLGECTDAAANVYIADGHAQKIYEYAHGGTKAIRTLDDSPYRPQGCAVNPKTRDIAVANYGEGYSRGGNIAVYPQSGKPVLYSGAGDDHFIACAYDKRGDLLTSSTYGSSGFYYGDFYYLPNEGVKLLPMALPGPSRSWQWGRGLSVAWDGKYWLVVGDNTLYQYTINIKAQYVGTITLDSSIIQAAIYLPLVKSHSVQVVGAGFDNSKPAVYYWNYPAGGTHVAEITKGLDLPYGVAISPGTP
jgi:hypothetical protein